MKNRTWNAKSNGIHSSKKGAIFLRFCSNTKIKFKNLLNKAVYTKSLVKCKNCKKKKFLRTFENGILNNFKNSKIKIRTWKEKCKWNQDSMGSQNIKNPSLLLCKFIFIEMLLMLGRAGSNNRHGWFKISSVTHFATAIQMTFLEEFCEYR